jgi:heat shock protein HspQ
VIPMIFQIGDIVFNTRRNFHGIVTCVDNEYCQLYILETEEYHYWCSSNILAKVNDV